MQNFKIMKIATLQKEEYMDQFKGGYQLVNEYFIFSTPKKYSLREMLLQNHRPDKINNLLYHAACAVERLHFLGFTHR